MISQRASELGYILSGVAFRFEGCGYIRLVMTQALASGTDRRWSAVIGGSLVQSVFEDLSSGSAVVIQAA